MKWTSSNTLKLKQLILDDKAYTMSDIALKLNMTKNSVGKKIETLILTLTEKEREKYKQTRQICCAHSNKKNLIWNDNKVKKLREACESGLYVTVEDMWKNNFQDMSYKSIKCAMSSYNIRMFAKKVVNHNDFKVEGIDTTPINNTSEQYWNMMETSSAEDIVLFKQESNHSIFFNKPNYIGITCIGDQHFGQIGTDYKQAREDAEIIKNTDNMYALFGGDFLENYIRANILSAMVSKDSSPKREKMLLDHYFSFFGKNDEEICEKVLASISGNHDWRTADVSGIDLIKTMLKGKHLLYSPEELRLDVHIGDIVYKVAARHMYRFNSTLNYTHTVKRWYDEGEQPFDVGIIWHNHKSDIEEFVKHNQMRLGIRPGSYKIRDVWAKGKGFPLTMPLMPTVVFNPLEKTMIAFKHVYEASSYLKLKNAELRRK